ncbi:MAG: mandelate racemase/muconate lactonizing enzyme family protein [Anaerolineae bacterium]|nr:mandelate racemase/muconate lactonizing enzyme family protein [Anaerolineae bacterium]
MKITAIKPYIVYVESRKRNQTLVKIETDEGIYGWGESGLAVREFAVEGAIRHYSEFLVGKDPFQIGRLWQEMYRSQYFEGGRVLTAAISAIDIALYDLKGKALGVPVYELLGGKQREYVPCFATVGISMPRRRSGESATTESNDKLIADVRLLVDNDWPAIRVGLAGSDPSYGDDVFEPRESIARTAEAMIAVREAVGLAPVIGVEYHHRLSVAEAASFCQRMPSGTLDFLEEPIRDETPEAYEALRKMTDVPFAIGEEFSSKWQFLPYIERGITNFARIDVCNVGGLTESMKVAGWAEAHYIDLMPHNPLGPICAAATVHLGAAAPNFAWMEVRLSPTESLGVYEHDLFTVQPVADGPNFPLPTAPGLGIEVNEELAASLHYQPSEPPHLRRRDNSVTNW